MTGRRERRGWSMLGRATGDRPGEVEFELDFSAADRAGADPGDEDLQRDAEESLVAALQESDTAVEVLHDQGQDDPAGGRRGWAIGLTGLVLAVAALVVARRRR